MTAVRFVRHTALLAFVAAAIAPASCSRNALVGENLAALHDGQAGGSAGAAGMAADSTTCHVTHCQDHLYDCGDCVDNDGDGLIDMDDPDCLGPCQNSEEEFFGNIPGQNNGNCVQDCYFDQDSGGGNDDCAWSHSCDPLSPQAQSCSYDPTTTIPRGARAGDCSTLQQTQSAQCATVCGPLTPNGCDCFGCCQIPGAPTAVWLGSVDQNGNHCDLAHVADPSRCRPCTQVTACLNPCDTCELCVGKRTLPSGCGQGGCETPVCPPAYQPCGTPCLPACQTGEICVTGCCIRPPA